jgi:hypothetical protein
MKTVIRIVLGIALLMPLAVSASAQTLPVSMPFTFENNQILLKVGINDSEPGWFILDTGASGCIVDTATARRLGIRTEGQAQGTGAGQGTVAITFANGITYRLQGASLTVPRSYVIDFSGQPALLGRVIAGVLGYEFFMAYVVELDFERRVMTLHDPATYTPPAGMIAVPFAITRKTPYITVRTKVSGLEPVDTLVQIDSGSGDAVDVNVLAQSPQRLEAIGGVGLGQEFRMVMGRGEWAEIGPFRLAAPTGATGGVQLIGSEVLRRFHVVFDYARTRMLLRRSRFFDDPFVIDASGLDLRWSDDMKTFRIHDVAANSPAAEAGLKTNELIVTVGRRPASSLTIAEFNRMLTRDGRTITLGVRGDGTLRQVRLRLRKRL